MFTDHGECLLGTAIDGYQGPTKNAAEVAQDVPLLGWFQRA